MPSAEPDRIAFFARTNFRDKRRTFGIKRVDRRAHMYVIGKTGTGKSTLLETLIAQDIAHGEGVALLDPHGDLAEKVLRNIPAERKGDLFYFDPVASEPLSFNPLEHVPPVRRPLAAAGLLEVFKKIWADSWGPRLEHILRNSLLALLDQPDATLGDVLRILVDSAFRRLRRKQNSESPRPEAFGWKSMRAIPHGSAPRRLRRSRTRWERSSRIRFSIALLAEQPVRLTCGGSSTRARSSS